MTPAEFTAGLHIARHPTYDAQERSAALAEHLRLDYDARRLLEEALNQQADIARSYAQTAACDACVYARDEDEV